MNRLVISILLGACATQALAETASPTGKRLFGWCASPRDSSTFAICTGYIAGFMQGVTTAQAAADNYQSNSLCAPPDLTGQQAVAVFLRTVGTLKEPMLSQVMGESAPGALASLAKLAFPCKKPD